FHRAVRDGVPQPRQPWVLRDRVHHRLDAEPNDHDRVPWRRGPELSQRVRGEAPALPHLAVQRLELPDRQHARPEAGAGLSLFSHAYGSTQGPEQTYAGTHREAQRLPTSLEKSLNGRPS